MDNATRILIVSHDALVRDHVRAVLRDAGFSVAEAASADEALMILASSDVAAKISDVTASGDDGLWLATTVDRKWPEIGLLVIAERAPAAGALPHRANYLQKPFSGDELLSHLRSMTRSSG